MKPVLNEKFNLSSWALNHQQMVSFFMLLIIAMGAFCYENLPRNEDPAFTIKTAVVSAQWPGASVTDTTRLLTDTLEKAAGNPWLDYLESETRAGSSVIHVNLRDDTPPQKVPDIWYQVRKKMQDIASLCQKAFRAPPSTTSLMTRTVRSMALYLRAIPCGRSGTVLRQSAGSSCRYRISEKPACWVSSRNR